MNLYHINLNLLISLDLLLTEQSVTNAAKKVSITQAAMSNNLQQLRVIFQDELLMRKKNHMLLTSYAKTLQPKLRVVIENLKNLIDDKAQFDLAACDRVFKIGMPDHWASLILPTLIPIVRHKAPHIKINIIPVTQMYSAEPFEKGYYDIGIARSFLLPESIRMQLLLIDSNVCIFNQNHPLAKKKKITLSDFKHYKHIACRVENPDFPSAVNHLLLAKGLPIRDTVLYVPYIDVIFRLIEQSDDLIATAVQSKTWVANKGRHCLIRPFPDKTFTTEFYIAWHKQYDTDPAHTWLRNEITRIVKNVEAEKC